MSQKVQKISTEEQLLQARQRGLQEANEVHTMKAHGKVLGMDTFSWMHPHTDTLASVFDTLPFKVFWVANERQVIELVNNYPEHIENINGLIIYDCAEVTIDNGTMALIDHVVCIEGLNEALTIFADMQKDKSVFLFTANGANALENKIEFEQFIAAKK